MDQWHAEAGLISYWVNQGALVIVAERGDNPESRLHELIEKGRWDSEGCIAKIMLDFECWTTREMNPESPLGEWFHSEASVMAFFNREWGVL